MMTPAQINDEANQLDDQLAALGLTEMAGGGVVHDDDGARRAAPRRRSVAESDDDDEEVPLPHASTASPPVDPVALRRSLPVLEISMTVARRSEHVFPAWCDAVYRFINEYCEAGGVALERGKRNERLHCQIMLRLHWEPDKLDQLKEIVRNYCGIRRGDGVNSVIEAHIFGEGQNWVAMLGYLHKDRLKSHWRVLLKGVTDQEVQEGIIRWTAAALSFEDGKTGITKTNIFKLVDAHYTSNPPLEGETMLGVLTDMMNRHMFYATVAFLSGPGGVMRADACEAQWRCIRGKTLVEADVRRIFFGNEPYKPGTAQRGARYYDAPSPVQPDASPLRADEGFLATDHPSGPAAPATRADLSAFVANMMNQGEAGGSSDAIRPDSPRSKEGSRHASDDEFLDDGEEGDGGDVHMYRALGQDEQEEEEEQPLDDEGVVVV